MKQENLTFEFQSVSVGWPVKKHLLAILPHRNISGVFKKTLSTLTALCNLEKKYKIRLTQTYFQCYKIANSYKIHLRGCLGWRIPGHSHTSLVRDLSFSPHSHHPGGIQTRTKMILTHMTNMTSYYFSLPLLCDFSFAQFPLCTKCW